MRSPWHRTFWWSYEEAKGNDKDDVESIPNSGFWTNEEFTWAWRCRTWKAWATLHMKWQNFLKFERIDQSSMLVWVLNLYTVILLKFALKCWLICIFIFSQFLLHVIFLTEANCCSDFQFTLLVCACPYDVVRRRELFRALQCCTSLPWWPSASRHIMMSSGRGGFSGRSSALHLFPGGHQPAGLQ